MNSSHSTWHPTKRILHLVLAVVMVASLGTPLLRALALPGASRALAADDDDIYDQVNRKLNSDADVHGRIKIEVKNGVVTLTGNVGTDKVRSKAEKIARKVPGVKDVVNKLAVGEDRPK